MGRWSQRRRGRGAGGTDNTIRMIELVEGASVTELDVAYSGEITDTDFAGSDFITDVTLQEPATIANDGPTHLILTFLLSTSLDTALTFTGLVPGIASPQTIAKT